MVHGDQILKTTSFVLKRYREDAGLSQEKLAEKSNVSRSMIDKIERRERLPSIETLIKIASGLDVKASDIVSEIEKKFM